MFIWDFLLGDVMDQIIDWVYSQIVGFLGDFFAQMGNMGAELFEMSWVQSIVLFFSYLAWTLYVVGLGDLSKNFVVLIIGQVMCEDYNNPQ